MTIPSPVLTVVPNTVTRTDADLTPSVTLTDTNTPSPAATGRNFRDNTTSVGTKTGTTAALVYPVELAAGAHTMNVQTTNTDGTGTSANVTLTVTDGVASVPTTITDTSLNTRQRPDTLPWEFRDPTVATPGLPTAVRLNNARRYGSTLT